MSTIAREFTKEQLQQIIETDHVQCGEASALARIALASLEAEPVCVIDQSNLDYLKSGSDADVWPASRTEMGDVLLYRAAPPSPVSVPDEDLLHMAASAIDDLLSNKDRSGAWVWADIPAKLRRAAMLQGAEPVSNSDELPLDYLQGHKDGLEWAAQLAEANHPQTGDWLYDDPIDLARAIRKGPDMPTVQAGNSPVTPDGSANILRRWLAFGRAMQSSGSQLPRHLIAETESMLAAAPQQEVTQALAKGMERYGDVMQKLADSGD
ncbi:DUF551 domain-containing protein [Escherichia coli]|uniref:DUF551 domain-containing protein n=1 Tax=Escherichia coli TaxID=562 RepID=UPI00208FDD42|nr:DUF551 domain-containing protein [Escherichia coli]